MYEGEGSLTPRVLILSRRLDPESDLVGLELLSRGIDHIRVNIEDIPTACRLSFEAAASETGDFDIHAGGRTVRGADISVALLRHFGVQRVSFPGPEFSRRFAYEQWDSLFRALTRRLTCDWINGYAETVGAMDRVRQLSVARRLGFNVPATIITNDPERARRFYHAQGGNIVLKAVHHHSVDIGGTRYSMYTRRIGQEDLALLEDLIWAPCLLQERIAKSKELRVTVIGPQVFCVEIDTQSAAAAVEDIHRGPLHELRKKPVSLPADIRNDCCRFIGALGLRYGAIDLIVDKQDRLVFLEVNPTGDWCWLEPQTELPITAAMADYIAGLAAKPTQETGDRI